MHEIFLISCICVGYYINDRRHIVRKISYCISCTPVSTFCPGLPYVLRLVCHFCRSFVLPFIRVLITWILPHSYEHVYPLFSKRNTKTWGRLYIPISCEGTFLFVMKYAPSENDSVYDCFRLFRSDSFRQSALPLTGIMLLYPNLILAYVTPYDKKRFMTP